MCWVLQPQQSLWTAVSLKNLLQCISAACAAVCPISLFGGMCASKDCFATCRLWHTQAYKYRWAAELFSAHTSKHRVHGSAASSSSVDIPRSISNETICLIADTLQTSPAMRGVLQATSLACIKAICHGCQESQLKGTLDYIVHFMWFLSFWASDTGPSRNISPLAF